MKIKPILLLISALLIFSACSKADEGLKKAQSTASDFTLETIDGEKITLSDILKEKKAVLVFWASWCPTCRREMPLAEKFYTDNKDKLELIGINVRESKAKAERFLRKTKVTYPIALDSKGDVAKLYKVRGIPTVIVVDKDSKIIHYGNSIKQMIKKIDF